MKSGILSSTQKVERLLPFLREHKEFSFDTETDGLSHDRKCIGFSLSVLDWDEYVGWYIPLRHERGEDLFSVDPSNVPLKVAYKIIEEICLLAFSTREKGWSWLEVTCTKYLE